MATPVYIAAGPRRAVGRRRWMLLEDPITGDPESVREPAAGLTRDHAERAAFHLRPFDLVGVGASLHLRVHTRTHCVTGQCVTQPRRENLGWRPAAG